jgi:hypothetical protein
MKEKLKKALAGVLVCFALVSIGYAIGKEVTLHRLAGRGGTGEPTRAPASGDKVLVYYLHRTLRCVTCNAIEKAAHETVRRDFAEHLRTGRVEWQTVNMDDDETLGERYDVASSTVVLVHLREGKELAYERLDRLWELADKPAELRSYVAQRIRAFLGRPAGSR